MLFLLRHVESCTNVQEHDDEAPRRPEGLLGASLASWGLRQGQVDAAGAGEGTCCWTGEVAKENLAKSSVQKSPVERLVRLDLLKTPIFLWFFFIQCMFRALLTCLGEFNHVASPVNCINCTVINPTVGKKGPNFRDLFGSLLGPYLYFSVFAKFTRRMSIQSSCTQQWENLICSWWENSCTISVCWELMHHMLTPAFWFLPLLMC